MYTNRELGAIGERIAERWLVQHDFIVIQKNFYARGSEIDIIAHKEGNMHFIEVKCVIHETTRRYARKVIHRANNVNKENVEIIGKNKGDVIHETLENHKNNAKSGVFVEKGVIHETNKPDQGFVNNKHKNKDNVIHETYKKHRTKSKLIDYTDKCVNHETQNGLKSSFYNENRLNNDVIHETKGFYRPEDKVDIFKLKRMKWGIQQYLYLKDIKDIPIFIDVIAIVLYRKDGNWQADVKCIDNVIIE